jgi:hypothetical protein
VFLSPLRKNTFSQAWVYRALYWSQCCFQRDGSSSLWTLRMYYVVIYYKETMY